MRFSIRLKLIAFTFCVVLLVGGGISLYGIYQGRQFIFTAFEKEARKVTALISESVMDELYFLDIRGLRRRLGSARVNPDISYTYVTDLDGLVLSDGSGGNPLRDEKLTDAFSRAMLHAEDWISRIEGETLKVGGPVYAPDSTRIGYLQVGFSLALVSQTFRSTTQTSLSITLICLGIGGLLAVILSTSFTRPILALVEASKEIGAGKLHTSISLNRSDELGMLADSINRMAANLRRNLETLTALREIDQAILSTLELHSVLDVLLEKIDLFLPYSAATVRLVNKENGILEPAACRNLNAEEWKAERWRAGRGPASVTLDSRAPLFIRNVQTDPRIKDQDFPRKYGLVSYLGIPLVVQDEVLGVISFYTKEEREFSSEEVEFLVTLAGQAALAIHHAQIYEEMRELASELSVANKMKSEFLSVISHEFRTPLTVIMGFTETIQSGGLGEINPAQEKALQRIMSHSSDLLAMISSVMEATKIEAGAAKVERHEVSLKMFLDHLKSAFDLPRDKGLNVIWDYPPNLPLLKTDGGKLRHILQNLIHNAVKFTEKGRVTILARHFPEARAVEFKISDTGIGIPQSELPFIFDMFRQVDSSESRDHGGVGLGLYIVKKFTELLGGRVEVESEPAKGTTFTLTLPCES